MAGVAAFASAVFANLAFDSAVLHWSALSLFVFGMPVMLNPTENELNICLVLLFEERRFLLHALGQRLFRSDFLRQQGVRGVCRSQCARIRHGTVLFRLVVGCSRPQSWTFRGSHPLDCRQRNLCLYITGLHDNQGKETCP